MQGEDIVPKFETRQAVSDVSRRVSEWLSKNFMALTKVGAGGSVVESKHQTAFSAKNRKKAVEDSFYIRIDYPKLKKDGLRTKTTTGYTKIRSANKGMQEFNYTYIPSVSGTFFEEVIIGLLGGKPPKDYAVAAKDWSRWSDTFTEGVVASLQMRTTEEAREFLEEMVSQIGKMGEIQLRIAGPWEVDRIKGVLHSFGLGLFPLHMDHQLSYSILDLMRWYFGYFDDGRIPSGAEWMRDNLPSNYERYLAELTSSLASDDVLKTSEVSIKEIIAISKNLHRSKIDKSSGRKTVLVMVGNKEGMQMSVHKGKVVFTGTMLYKAVDETLEKISSSAKYLVVADAASKSLKNVGKVDITGISSGDSPKPVTIKASAKKNQPGVTAQKIGLPAHTIIDLVSGRSRQVDADKIVVSAYKHNKLNGTVVPGEIDDFKKYLEIVQADQRELISKTVKQNWDTSISNATSRQSHSTGDVLGDINTDFFSRMTETI